jgi:hypothetical protein
MRLKIKRQQGEHPSRQLETHSLGLIPPSQLAQHTSMLCNAFSRTIGFCMILCILQILSMVSQLSPYTTVILLTTVTHEKAQRHLFPRSGDPLEMEMHPRLNKQTQPVGFFSDPYIAQRPGIRTRHLCIQAIRNRHDEIFRPIMFGQPGNHTSADKTSYRTLIVDPSYHENVGDTMLTESEFIFFQNHFSYEGPIFKAPRKVDRQRPPAVMEQCHFAQAGNFYPPCDSVIAQAKSTNFPDSFYSFLDFVGGKKSMGQSIELSPKRLAFWQAGGNWGDLWRHIQSKSTNIKLTPKPSCPEPRCASSNGSKTDTIV